MRSGKEDRAMRRWRDWRREIRRCASDAPGLRAGAELVALEFEVKAAAGEA